MKTQSFLPAAAVAAAIVGLTGCGAQDSQLTCSVTQMGNGSVITCPDGTSTTISSGAGGATGATGAQGLPGQQGLGSGIFSSAIPVSDTRCQQGNGGFQYTTFIDLNNSGIFEDGDTVTSVNYLCNGATGATGAAGASSSMSLVAASAQVCPYGGWTLTVTNSGQAPASYPLCNGATGAQGQQGPQGPQGQQGPQGAQGPAGTSPLSLVQLIAPCGIASSAWKEELILLSDGSLLADISDSADGRNTRLSLISDGSYIDTDDSGCVFTISTAGTTRSLTWNGGGLSWSTPVGPSGATPIH